MNQRLVNRLLLVLPWLISIWLLVMTGWYVMTARSAFDTPLNKGDDLYWVRWWVGFAVVVVLSHIFIRRRFITLVWLALQLVAAVSMIVLSHRVTAALITVWLLLLSWAWGDWALRKMQAQMSARILEAIPVAVPLGLALMGLFTLALSMTRLLAPKWAWLAFSLLTLVQWRSLSKLAVSCHRWFVSVRPFNAAAPISPDVGIILVFMGFMFLLDLSWALAAEIHYDALAAHLPTAKSYVEHPVALASYTGYVANLVNLLFAMAMSLHGQSVAKLLVLASSVLSTLGVYALGRMFFSTRVGLWAAALFFTTPLVSWISTTAYIDAGVTMFLLAALLAFFRWREDREIGWLRASGLLTGAAVAAKFNALLGLPVIGLVLLWDLIRSRQPVRERLKALAQYILGVVIVAAPCMSIAYTLTGNPFFPLPLLDKIFKSSAGPAANLIANSNIFGIGTSPMSLLKLPLAFTFYSEAFGEGLPKGGLGLSLMLVPLSLGLLIAAGAVLRRQVALMLAVCIVYIDVLAYIMQYGRYLIPLMPLVVVLAVAPIFHFSKPKWLLGFNLVLLGIVVATQVALTPLMYWNIPERFPMRMAFGLETRESLLLRSSRLYGSMRFLNNKVGPGEKVLAIGGETGRIYLNAPMVSPYDPDISQIENRSTPSTLASNLKQHGISYLFVNGESWQSRLPFTFLTETFLSKFTDLELPSNQINIYRLRDVPMEPGSVSNLLGNPGFEVLSSNFPADWFAYGQPRISQSSAQARSGKRAVGVDPNNGMFTRVSIEPNKIYSLGHWCRADKPGQLARLQINWLDGGLQMVGVSIDAVECGPQWAWHKVSFMSPAGASLAQVYVSVHENSEVWLDDYVFVPGAIHAAP